MGRVFSTLGKLGFVRSLDARICIIYGNFINFFVEKVQFLDENETINFDISR